MVVPVPNKTKSDCTADVVLPFVQLNSLCIYFPASAGSVTQTLYRFMEVATGQLIVIWIVSFTVESVLTITVACCSEVEFLGNVNDPS